MKHNQTKLGKKSPTISSFGSGKVCLPTRLATSLIIGIILTDGCLIRLRPLAIPSYNRLLSANRFSGRTQAYYDGGHGAHHEGCLSDRRSLVYVGVIMLMAYLVLAGLLQSMIQLPDVATSPGRIVWVASPASTVVYIALAKVSGLHCLSSQQ